MNKVGLSAEDLNILSVLSTEHLRVLASISTSGKQVEVLVFLARLVIDREKEYSFRLQEDEKLVTNHAYSRGKAAFGTQFIHLLGGASKELARREKIQEENRKKQLGEKKNE